MKRRQLVLAAGAAPLLGACERSPSAATAELQGGWIGSAQDSGHAWRDGRLPQGGPLRRAGVAIVGAGVAGLAAARALRLRGVDDVHVFDADTAAGGNARGHQLAGLPCPLGAHYLPLPGPQAHEVSELLFELGLLRTELGRTQADERHLCHSPQERVFFQGHWQEGLLPHEGLPTRTLAQYRQFAQAVREANRLGFALPTRRAPWTPAHAALDALTMSQWLGSHGLDDPWLLAYLDHCCRDDYGGGLDVVSAWAGLHYFASRHGFQAPGEAESDGGPVFTWPQGNAWLTERLAAPLGERLHTQALVSRIEPSHHDVTLQVWDSQSQSPQRWAARQVILCTPLFIAARLLAAPPPALQAAAAHLQYAPWLVSNLHLAAPLLERLGTQPAWDNIRLAPDDPPRPDGLPPGLGYVNAQHQSLQATPGARVLTHYWALGAATPAQTRQRRLALLEVPWTTWARRVVSEIQALHPDLPSQLTRIELQRWGHAMAMPTPGTRGLQALHALALPQGRLHFAHADLSGHSVFEEAYTHGHRAGHAAAKLA